MQEKNDKKAKKNRQRGAIIVEATIALSAFIFAMFTIYSVIDICYVQSKMAVAVNAAAKEMSQYAYLYSTLGLDKNMSGSGGKSLELMEGLGTVMENISGGASVISEDLGEMFSGAGAAASGDSASEYIKNGVGMGLAKKLVEKNLVTYEGDTADAFLRRNRVVDGLDGLDFTYTAFLTDADQDEVDIIVSYDVQVIKLLNLDFEFSFMQRATTKAWNHATKAGSGGSGGSSTQSSETIWETGALSRGKEIVNKEKSNYTYTSDSNGFHAYNSNGNEFVRIRSINTFEETYSDSATGQSALKNTLNSSFNDMYKNVSKLDEPITVNDSSGKNVQLGSDPDSRNYKIVLVVPDDADMTTVDAAISAFEAEQKAKGNTVTVQVKTGYGNHEGVKTTEEDVADAA